MKVFYDERQQVSDNESRSPSAGKPKLVLESWQDNYDVEIMPVTPLTEEQIRLAHNAQYVRGILDCTTKNGFDNTLKSVADSLPWTTGSFASAAIHALEKKECTFSPTSGFHHACYDNAMGFCTFSGLTITAILLNLDYGANRVGIVDLDSHYGNGTVDTIKRTSSGGFTAHYTLGGDRVRKSNNKRWLENFPKFLRSSFLDCDIILYQAGADCHENDPFVDQGHFSDEQIHQRDRIMYEFSKEAGVPIVANLAGGYQEPVEKVIKLHNYLAQAYNEVFH
jgi:acetoin utilization deacetylase AcuC-like enzyme